MGVQIYLRLFKQINVCANMPLRLTRHRRVLLDQLQFFQFNWMIFNQISLGFAILISWKHGFTTLFFMALDLSSICHSLRHLHIVSYCICGEFHLMLEIHSHIKYSSLERLPDISPHLHKKENWSPLILGL